MRIARAGVSLAGLLGIVAYGACTGNGEAAPEDGDAGRESATAAHAGEAIALYPADGGDTTFAANGVAPATSATVIPLYCPGGDDQKKQFVVVKQGTQPSRPGTVGPEKGAHRLEVPEGAVTRTTVFMLQHVRHGDHMKVMLGSVPQNTLSPGAALTLVLHYGDCPDPPDPETMTVYREDNLQEVDGATADATAQEIRVELRSLSTYVLATPT